MAARGSGVLVAFAALLECSCALPVIGPVSPAGVGIDVPTAWTAPIEGAISSGPIDTRWWDRFEDPLLQSLVARALRANAGIGSAQAVLAQARALRDLAAAALWPALSASASAQDGRADGNSTGARYQAGLNLNWTPDVFGVNRRAVQAGTAALDASAASLGETEVAVAAEVGLNYILLRGAQARRAIALENLDSQAQTLEITGWRQQAGLVTMLQVEQARAALEQTRASLPLLQTAIDQSRHALALLTGDPPGDASPWWRSLVPMAAIPVIRSLPALAIPAQVLRQRADVRAAEHQVSAAMARVEQARAARLPGFGLAGSIGLSAATLGSLASGASVVSALLASASLPLLDGGALDARLRSQQAALEQARQAYRAAVLTALKEVEDALVALRADGVRLVSLREAARAAGSAAGLARQSYESGLVDFQVVLETQRTRLGTQDAVASASADESADQIRLFKVLGGGWPGDCLGAPPVPPGCARSFEDGQTR